MTVDLVRSPTAVYRVRALVHRAATIDTSTSVITAIDAHRSLGPYARRIVIEMLIGDQTRHGHHGYTTYADRLDEMIGLIGGRPHRHIHGRD